MSLNRSITAKLLNSIKKHIEVNLFNTSLAALNKSIEFNNVKIVRLLQPFGEEWLAYRFSSSLLMAKSQCIKKKSKIEMYYHRDFWRNTFSVVDSLLKKFIETVDINCFNSASIEKVNFNAPQLKEAHFAIILFCKESKSAIRIKKFWLLKFDLPMTFDPQEMASKMTSDYFDSIFHVPWSVCNQKLPDKWR